MTKDLSAAFAWDGHSVYGDGRSIAAVHRAVDTHRDMLAALHAAANWFTPPNDSRTAFPLKQIADAIAKADGTQQE